MGVLTVSTVSMLIVAVIVFRLGPDRQIATVRRARILRWAALIPLVLQGLFFLAFGVGEMAGGDLSGAGHLIQVAMAVAVGWLVWTRPLETGAVLVISGVLAALATLLAMPREPGAVTALSPFMLILVLPQVVVGVLALLAGLAARKKQD